LLLLYEVGTPSTVFIPLPLLIPPIAFLLPLRSVLKLDRCIPASVFADKWDGIGEMGLETCIEGIGDALKGLFLLGVVGIGSEEALVNGDQNLTIVRRHDLDLV
jgi:hypothetical protein